MSRLVPASLMDKKRCSWLGEAPLEIAYHDTEWGVLLHDDRRLFEFIVLDAMQAGLNWRIVLQKRHSFQQAMDGCDREKIARYDDRDLARLLDTTGIIRNRQKLTAAITNARAVLALQEESGSLDSYVWQFVNNKPVINAWTTEEQIPATSSESHALSRDLIKPGFQLRRPDHLLRVYAAALPR